jgi:putative phage-type endonuclease
MVLKSLPQPTQKTTEWYEYRHNLLTASSIWKALSSESQRNSLIYEKCKPLADEKSNWFGGGSLQWGILYEMVSVMVYEKKYNTRVADFGCIQHINHSFIGASPDGINVDPKSDRYGRMIEIKNIVNRDITDKPKEEYWIQMQVQMETCDLDECDFIETRFKEYESPEAYADDINQESKGVILCFLQRNVPDSKPIYKYMPLDLDMTYQDWIINTKDDFKDTLVLYTTTYWYMDEFSCILVKRNPNWFQSALPTILTTWETILKERKTGYEHRAAKKREVTQENHNITNVIKLKKNTCLVKL